SIDDITSYLSPSIDSYPLILVNGRLIGDTSSTPHNLVQVLSFTEAAKIQHPSFTQYVNRYDAAHLDVFSALNPALFTDGLFIHINDQATLDKPICIYQSTDNRVPQGISYPHVLMTTGKNSKASIISSWHTIGEHISFTNSFTQIHVGVEAHLEYYN